MTYKIKISEEHLKILHEEQDLLLKVREGFLMLEAENKKNHIGNLQFENIIELRDSIKDTLPEDIPSVMAQLERMILVHSHQDKNKFISNLNLENPYFAHIRLREEKRIRDLLIGNQNCFSTYLPCPIVDWKNSPVSKIFYRYREGDEFVEDLGERELEGELVTRRMLFIENGNLLRINWAEGILENFSKEDEETNDWHFSKCTNPRLEIGKSKTLSEIGKNDDVIYDSKKKSNLNFSGYRIDKHLRQITALIDPKQFDLITHSESGIVLIQGGAGSGKTTVALHRLAYLMSKRPKIFKPKNVLPIVFGPALANYMSKVLPALGVKGVAPKTYQKWVSGLRRNVLPELPYQYSESTPMDVIEIKRHPLWLTYYKEEIKKRSQNFRNLFIKKLSNIEQIELVIKAWDTLNDFPLIPRLLNLISWSKDDYSIESIERLSSLRIKKRLQNVLEKSFPELFESPHLLISQIWNDCLVNKELLNSTVNRLAPGEFKDSQISSVWTWAVRQYQNRQVRKDIIDIENETFDPQKNLMDNRVDSITNEKALLDEEDDSLLLILYQLAMGPLKRKNGKFLKYSHLMLDEAQDFGPLELQLLVSLTNEHLPSVTLAGDLDQRIMLGRKNESWEQALSYLTLPNGKKPDITALEPLKIGYRSTSEIMDVAKNIIGEYSVNKEWYTSRKGAPVEFFRLREKGTMIAFLTEILEDLTIREPHASVALLLRSQESALSMYEGLQRSDLVNLRFIKDQEFSFTPGIDITNIAQTKGLEFDTVIIADVDASTYGPDLRSRQLLYVGVTRASHQLWLLHCGNKSKLISGIEERLF